MVPPHAHNGRVSCTAAMRLRMISQYSGSRSMPMAEKPSWIAARRVVPEPANGSRTVPPGGVTRRIIQAAKSRGYAAGWPRESVSHTGIETKSRHRAIPSEYSAFPLSHLSHALLLVFAPIHFEGVPFALGSHQGRLSFANHKMRSHERRGRPGCPIGGASGFTQINSSHSIHPASRSAKRVRCT